MYFLYDALWYAPQYFGDEPGDSETTPRHCSPRQLCNAFIRYAKDCFGDEYDSVLKQWNLATSERLGEVVFGLIAKNLMQAEPTDCQDDFGGQFDLTRGDA
jgi:uncharacterized repeat protein (TIGR04138 family)